MATESWEHISERGSVWSIRLFAGVLNLLGYRVARFFLPLIVLYFVVTGRRSRMASREYLRRLKRTSGDAPNPSWRAVFRHHHEFAINMLDRVLLWQGRTDSFEFYGHGRELVADRDRPASLIVGSHLGSFDLLRVIALDFERDVHVVMYRAHAQRVNTFLNALNPDANLRVIEIAPDDMEGVLQLKRCIDNGDHIAILADRTMPGGRGRNQMVPFLGEPAVFPESPWMLAEVLGCPVVMANAVRTGDRRYEITVEPIADRVRLRGPQGQSSPSPLEVYVGLLERLCRRHPYQWFNFYDYWLKLETEGTGRNLPTQSKGGAD